MKEFKIPERYFALGDVLRYDRELKEDGKAGHFSELERIRINQERGQLLAGNENYHHAQALREKIEFVMDKSSPQPPPIPIGIGRGSSCTKLKNSK